MMMNVAKFSFQQFKKYEIMFYQDIILSHFKQCSTQNEIFLVQLIEVDQFSALKVICFDTCGGDIT
jgi:hypothetical protein